MKRATSPGEGGSIQRTVTLILNERVSGISRGGLGKLLGSFPSHLVRHKEPRTLRTLEARMRGSDSPPSCQTLTILEYILSRAPPGKVDLKIGLHLSD